MAHRDFNDETLARDARQRRIADLFETASAASQPEERKEALDEIVVLSLPVARSIAGRYRNRGVPSEDLEQVACMALVKAAQRFEPARGLDFLAYAVPTIRGEVRKYFRDLAWSIRPPRRLQELQGRLLEVESGSEGEGQPRTTAEIAEALGESEDLVRQAQQAHGCFSTMSLDAPMGDQSTSFGDLVPSDDEGDRDAIEARVLLRPVVRRLRARDRRILQLRFVEGATQAEIGAELGVTQMQVSRLLRRILTDLREEIGELDDVRELIRAD